MNYLKKGFSTNILVIDKNRLKGVQTYLEILGTNYHQNVFNPGIKEFHYFIGDSTVFITELPNKFNIVIFAKTERDLCIRKTGIEEILKI